jgi:hypothetical protein
MATGDTALHVVERDRLGAVGVVPGLLAELLEEVGEPHSQLPHPAEGVVGPMHALVGGRHHQRFPGLVGVQGADGGEDEHALGVGLGLVGESSQVGQAGGGDGDRQAELRGPVQAHDERLQGGGTDVVELVNGHQDPRGVVGGHLSQLDEQTSEVGGQVP